MYSDTLTDAILVTDSISLNNLVQALQQAPVIAVDTESNSLYAYRERVCLIQFSTTQADYLVDPLECTDLSSLAPIFANPQIEKVFHAAEYDIICLKRDFDFQFNHLFDTMVAARILGRSALGLGAILAEEFGVQLDKRYQRANWGKRPIASNLLDYARLDTHYLIPLQERLKHELQVRDLFALAEEDFQRLCSINSTQNNGNHVTAACWRVSGSHDLTPQQAAILQALCVYRDQIARTLDRPVFKIINDHTLLAIAHQAPNSLDELRRIPGMSPQQIRRHGMRLLETVRRGLADPPLYPPRTNRPNDAYMDRIEALRRWRKEAAKAMGVTSDVILPRDLMFALADRNPRTPAELALVMKDVPWRLEKYGSKILQVLVKK